MDGTRSNSNKKYDLFISEYLKNGLNATEAYQKLHPTASRRNSMIYGYKWLKKEYVIKKLEKEQKKLMDKYEISREVLLNDLMVIKDEAFKNKKYNESIKAIELITKMLGLQAPQKMEVESKIIQVVFGGENNDIDDDQII